MAGRPQTIDKNLVASSDDNRAVLEEADGSAERGERGWIGGVRKGP
jgi:hypothetical protein